MLVCLCVRVRVVHFTPTEISLSNESDCPPFDGCCVVVVVAAGTAPAQSPNRIASYSPDNCAGTVDAMGRLSSRPKRVDDANSSCDGPYGGAGEGYDDGASNCDSDDGPQQVGYTLNGG